MDDLNDSGCHALRPLNAMNSSGLWMKSTTSGSELRSLDAMNKSRLLMT